MLKNLSPGKFKASFKSLTLSSPNGLPWHEALPYFVDIKPIVDFMWMSVGFSDF